MALKKELSRGIVADFHSAEAAAKAAEDWAKQFQKDQVPQDLDFVEISLADVIPLGSGGGAVRPIGGIEQPAELEVVEVGKLIRKAGLRIDKLVRMAGLATSNTEAAGKHKQGAVSLVSIDGENIDIKREMVVMVPVNQDLVLRVGRKMKRIRVIGDGIQWK
jgi:tyrosyl-tRNA synthetase